MPNAIQDAIQAVIFDFDGTLIDTFPAIHAAWNAAMEPIFGRQFSRDEVIDRFGPSDEGMLANELKALPPSVLESATEIYFDAYTKAHQEMTAFEGIEAMLDALETRGVPMGVMTGKGRRAADITLADIGWKNRFGVVVTGTEVTNFKPAPDGPLLAAKLMGVSPERCFYVGDSPADLGAARAAGMKGIVAGWHTYFLPQLREMQPELWADTPAEVVALFDSCR